MLVPNLLLVTVSSITKVVKYVSVAMPGSCGLTRLCWAVDVVDTCPAPPPVTHPPVNPLTDLCLQMPDFGLTFSNCLTHLLHGH